MERWYVPTLDFFSPMKLRQFLHAVTDENVWCQFDSYAQRVREFTHRCRDSQGAMGDIPAIHPSVYVLLARTKKYIFPNLRTLHAATDQSTTPLELILCITPSLRSFQLAPSDERYALTDKTYTIWVTLDMLATGNGGTPNVNIQYLEMRAVVPVNLKYLDKILSLTNLCSLRVNGIIREDDDVASDYVLRLSMLPHLKDLLLSLQENETFFPARNGGFQSLKYLTIQGNGPSLENFFDAILSNRLQYATIMDSVEWDTNIWAYGAALYVRGVGCMLRRTGATGQDTHHAAYHALEHKCGCSEMCERPSHADRYPTLARVTCSADS
jgi:hypothetical protein